MTLAFFIISALDLLDILDTQINAAERGHYVDWIYQCQHPLGGFKGFTGGDVGLGNEMTQRQVGYAEGKNIRNNRWDSANIAATYFALVNLVVLGDDLSQVDVEACWRWVRGLQLDDGSFGEGMGSEEEILGGKDVRFCYCALGIRWILSHLPGNSLRVDGGEDVELEKVVRFVETSQVCACDFYFTNNLNSS